MNKGNSPRGGNQLESILAIVFYILALATLVSYFVWSDNRYIFMICGILAIATRAITYIIRLIK